MPWNLNSEKAVYLQLMNHIERNILSGTYQPGERLPSVRELAAQAGVNPNTMQKALQELERNELVFAERTSGRFITKDNAMILKIKKDIALEETRHYYDAMKKMGFTQKELMEFIREYCKEGSE